MRTIKIENVPNNLYKALRARARESKRSISAEIVCLLRESIPTEDELRKRRAFYRKVLRMQKRKQSTSTAFSSSEDMVREDRAAR
ncbi:MAG: FitA-like ribbon-helix-helix domain-containing protein [Candidatus Acidiferrales bacterium]